MNDVFVWWVYGGGILLFAGYALRLLSLARKLDRHDR